MTLNRVTITGADDFTEPKDLVELSEEFPFVEWAILLSETKEGLNPRYPSPKWIEELSQYKDKINLAGHICGAWVRKLAVNLNDVVFKERPEFLELFPRIQLNFSCYNVAENMLDFLPATNEFIFQVSTTSKIAKINLAQKGKKIGLNTSVLYDRSGGKGKLPSLWEPPILGGVYTGYAGGLGPDNLQEQIGKISDVAAYEDFWIDMESQVRTDEKFDLEKVRTCLEIAKSWVENPPKYFTD